VNASARGEDPAARRARDRRSIGRRLAVFGPMMIVVITGVLSYVSLLRVVRTRDSVMHTRDVLDASSSLLTALLDAETGERGYLLTRDSLFLGPYRSIRSRVDDALNTLRALTQDNASQQRRIDTLKLRAHERLALLDTAIADEQGGHEQLAVRLVAHSQGKVLMDDVRGLIGRIQAEEEGLLHERTDAEYAWRETSGLVLVLGTALAAMLALAVNRGFDRLLESRQRAHNDTQLANERLQDQALELEQQAQAARSAALAAEEATARARGALRSAEESERRAERLQAATEAFTGALSLGEVANLIVDQALAALGAQSGALAAVESDGGSIRVIAQRGMTSSGATTTQLSAPLPLSTAIRDARPVLLAGPADIAAEYPGLDAVHGADDVRAIAAFPMATGGRTIGGLLVRFGMPHELNPADRAFMHALSRIAAEAFERARLFDAERQARAAAEAANRTKAAFLASMSHELRTPLQAALGFAQLMRGGVYGPVTEQQAEALERVERSQLHLRRLIDDILDFARLEAGRVRIEVESVRLDELMQDVVRLVGPDAAKKQLALTTKVPAEGAAVLADHQRLLQILLNLVGNAIKFTRSGGHVSIEAMADESRVRIRVRDTGVGIPPDRLHAVFDPFVQVDDALTRTVEGAGLGLSISRDLARAMAGDITVESEIGHGSVFTVDLPRAVGA
jgi:signal transduction histidine kinase/CHASE3 domain sensor protein